MSAPQNMSRKRPAPGTAPAGYQQQTPLHDNYQGAVQPLTDDQFFNWGANSQDPVSFPNQPVYNTQPNPFQQQPQAAPPPNQSTQLTRRPMNNQVVSRPPQQNGQWSQQASTPQQQDSPETWSDDINDLLRRAQEAKRESQSKRKQIPPFVMKLHR